MGLGLQVLAAGVAGPEAEDVSEDVPGLTAEEIAEIDPDIPPAATRSEAEWAAARAGVSTDLVVLLALFVIRKNGVGLGNLLEAALGLGVAFVGVGVILLSQLSIGALDFVLGRLFVDAEDLVEVVLEPVARRQPSPSLSSASVLSVTSTLFS